VSADKCGFALYEYLRQNRSWHITQPHFAIFIAIKQPVVTGSSWPLAASDIVAKGLDYFFKISVQT
jgi:hypothetical protein